MSEFKLHLRSQIQPFKGSDEWHAISLEHSVPIQQTALLLCDIWDKHWCQSATYRCGEIARQANQVAKSARQKGAQIIHAPSDTMEFYENFEQRQMMQNLANSEMPTPLDLPDPPQPIDASDGGCDDDPQCEAVGLWTQQDPIIEIGKNDGISDNGQEVYNLLRLKEISTLLIMGVHTNMCILGRSFSIKAMTRIGVNCILVRDLTDAMYNPKRFPALRMRLREPTETTALIFKNGKMVIAGAKSE